LTPARGRPVIITAASPPVVAMEPRGNAIRALGVLTTRIRLVLVTARYHAGPRLAPRGELETPRLGEERQDRGQSAGQCLAWRGLRLRRSKLHLERLWVTFFRGGSRWPAPLTRSKTAFAG
jgi:hypothetical protein